MARFTKKQINDLCSDANAVITTCYLIGPGDKHTYNRLGRELNFLSRLIAGAAKNWCSHYKPEFRDFYFEYWNDLYEEHKKGDDTVRVIGLSQTLIKTIEKNIL